MFKRTLTLMSVSLILFASCGSDTASVNAPANTNGANRVGAPPAGMPPNGQQAPGLPPNAEELRIKYPEFIAALEAMQNLDPQAKAAALDQLFVEHPEWKDLLPAPPAGGQAGGPPPQRPGAPVPSPSAA